MKPPQTLESRGQDIPLLMLPGTLCDARVFAPLLAQDPISRRGAILHGEMTGQSDARALAREILDSAPARFIPVGFSLGGIVALELAMLAPDRILGMVLIAANARPVPQSDHAARRAMAELDPVQLVGEHLWPRYVAPARLHDQALRESIKDMAAAASPQTLARQTELAITRSDKRPHLGAMAMPVLVLGGALDAIAPPALQHELAAGLPHATLRLAPDAGHFLPLECPEFCALALAEWLASAFALA
jgi:pimeloyl-ACP methyl ester carboxylesterase